MKYKFNFLFLFVVCSYLSCHTKIKNGINVAIYPLHTAYDYEPDSSFFQQYIIYNLPDSFDTSTIKTVTKLFIDSVIKNNHQYNNFQFKFYKRSKDLDTTYSDDRMRKSDNSVFDGRDGNDDLMYYQDDLLGEYSYEPNVDSNYWFFYKAGKIMGDNSPIIIKDVPDSELKHNDSIEE